MAVNSETIEIRLSGLDRIRELERRLLSIEGIANSLSGAIDEVGTGLQRDLSALQRNVREARALRTTRAAAQDVLNNPRAARALGRTGRRQLQEQIERQGRLLSDVYEPAIRSLGQAVREGRAQQRAMQTQRRQVASLTTGIGDDITQTYSQLGDTQEQVIRQLRGTRRRTRVAGTRALIEARRDDARRLAGSSNLLTGNLVQRDRNITAQTAAVNRRIDTLERSELSARRAAGAQARSLRRQQTAARSSGDIVRVGDLQNEIQEIGRNLARELDTVQSTRSSLATELGRLNQGRRSLGAISRGRSTVSRAGESIRRRARELEEVYGVRPSELSVNIGGRQTRIDQATRRAGLEANVRDNIEGAKTILGLASRRLTFLERELGLNNKIQDAEQKRANTLQQLGDRLQSLRASRASGPQMQNFENLLGQLQQAANTRNMPQFNRLAASAKAAADSAASALATEQKRQNLLTQESKALNSIRVQQQQIADLASKSGATASPSFQRASGAVARLPQLLQSGDFNEFNRVLGDATAFSRIVRSELGIQARGAQEASATQKRIRKYQTDIGKIEQKLLSGKQLQLEEGNRLLAYNRSIGAGGLPALPPAAPGSPAMSGRARPLRTQSVISGAAQPAVREILGGARTTEEAEATKRLADSLAVKAGKKAGPKFAQEFISGAADKFNAGQLLSAFGAAFNVFSDKSISKITRGTTAGGPRQLDPQAAQQRLARDLFAGGSLVGKLQNLERKRVAGFGAADPRTVEVSQQVVKLETELNTAKQAGFELTKQNLDALTATVNKSRQLLELDAQQNKLSTETAKIRRIQGERRLPQLQRDSLTSILGDLGRASSAAKVFRGGRSGEQALSNIIGAFNASTAPPKALPLAPGPTAPRYTGPDAGREMEIDRYRGIFAGLTNNPRFYNRLLQRLPREAVTTTMAGRASDISKAVEDAKRPDRKALESSIRLAYEEAVGNIPSAVTELFDKIGSVFDSIVNRVKGGTGGVSGAGGGAGGKPPLPPAAGGPEPQDFAGRVDAARGSADRLLGLKDLANLSAASANQLELLSQALSETRNGLKMTDKGFDQLTKVLNKVDDQIARRDPNADFLTRRFGRRGGQAVGEGLIGGAFPLLFGQGAGAAAGGGLGGFFGGMAGGTLGFGLSLAGTAIGSQVDLLMQATQDTGNMLRDLVGNFEQIKESGLLASRSQEKLIGNLLEAGNKTAAYAIIQDELNRKLGVDGAAKLREAADAGDRLKRAMADLGVQMQLFIAGPLTDLLNKISGAISRDTEEQRFKSAFEAASPEAKRAAETQINPSRNPKNKSFFSRISDTFFLPATGLESLFSLFGGPKTPGTSAVPIAKLREVTAGLQSSRPQRQPTPQEQRDKAIGDAETRRDAAQRELEVFNKRNEGVDILKGFKQQANAIRREQEDINRQSFELRRDYERQIEDIRRGVEDKISQLRQENAQKELEILVKQGQIREQQFKNAATALQGALAGDPLAQSLADAVTTYLGAQLSAQNEIEQRRKQFEIEINNQQVELEKYKLDVARTISRLNTDTAEKVAQINLGIARRNEDAALNSFATEKQTAKLRFQLLAAELRVLEAKELNTAAQASAEAQRNPLMLPEYTAQFDAATSNATRLATAADNIVKNLIPQLEQIAPPPRLGEIAPVATRGVSLAGVNAQKARGDQLRAQFQAFSDELTGLVETGNFAEFTNRISEIGRGGFDELSNNLDTARKELALVGGDFGPIAQGITDAYQKVIDDLPRLTAKLTPELQAQVPALKQYLEVAKQSQIQLEQLRPTLEFYITGYGDLKSQTEQAKNSISELLSPTKNYDRLLEQINKRGGLGINEEGTRRLLEAARNLDELNARLKVLNGLNDIAGGWTDSFIQLNKELLKGGNLLESVQRFAEGVADRTLDVVLEFTLRPIQEQLFKNLSKVLGIEAPQDPTLLPIKETAQNTKDLVDLQKRQFAGQTGIKLPEAANNIVAAPSAAPAASTMTGRYMQGNIGPTSTGPHFHVMRQDGSYYPKNALDQYVEVNGRPLSSVPVSRGQEYGAPREYGPHTGRDYAFPNGASLGLMNGAKWIGNTPGTSVGDRTAFMTPDGKVYEIIHGRFKGEAKPIAPVAQQPAAVQAAAGPTPAPVPSGVTPDGRQYFPIPPGAPGSPNNPASIPVDKYVEPTTNASNKAADSIANLDQKASAAADGLQGLTQQTSETVTKFQTIVGTSLQAISSIAMGIGGAQMIRKGGAYNTLMGAASIFGSISSITGMFGTGGGLSGLFGRKPKSSLPGFTGEMLNLGGLGLPGYASGGRPDPHDPAIIGENGPELWVPDRPGTIIPNDELYVPGLDDKGGSAPSIGRYSRRAASSMESSDGESGDTIYTGNYGRAVPYQRSETTREIDRLERITTNPKELPPIKYETTRVNEYDFVTPEQLEASNARTAKIARNQTIRELADSMKTRKRLGL